MKLQQYTPRLVLGIAALTAVLATPAGAQTYTPEEKQRLIEFGEQFETAWDLYQHFVKEANGGTPLTPATLPDWWQRNLIAYLPTGATGSLAGTVAGRSAATLPTATAYLVVTGWAVALVVAAGTLFARRDA